MFEMLSVFRVYCSCSIEINIRSNQPFSTFGTDFGRLPHKIRSISDFNSIQASIANY